MPALQTGSLDTLYAVVAVGTTCGGLVGLSAGVHSEVVTPIVLVGAVVVGFISLYWLFDGDKGRTDDE